MNKILFGLSLARKSGKLVFGFDKVVEAMVKGQAKLVLIASDVSSKTRDRVKYQNRDSIPVYTTALTQFDFSKVANRLTGILAITDENLAKLCQNAIENEEGEN